MLHVYLIITIMSITITYETSNSISSGLRDQGWGSRRKITTWRTSIIVRSFTRIISDFRVHPTLSDFWKCSIHSESQVSYCINKRNKTDIDKVKFVLHYCWCHYDEILSILKFCRDHDRVGKKLTISVQSQNTIDKTCMLLACGVHSCTHWTNRINLHK